MKKILSVSIVVLLTSFLFAGCEKKDAADEYTFEEYYKEEYARLESEVKEDVQLVDVKLKDSLISVSLVEFIGEEEYLNSYVEFIITDQFAQTYQYNFDYKSMMLDFKYNKDGLFFIQVKNHTESKETNVASIVITEDGYKNRKSISKHLEDVKKSFLEDDIEAISGLKTVSEIRGFSSNTMYTGSSKKGKVELEMETVTPFDDDKSEDVTVEFSKFYKKDVSENYPDFSKLEPQNCYYEDDLIVCKKIILDRGNETGYDNVEESYNYTIDLKDDSLHSVKYQKFRISYYDKINTRDAAKYYIATGDSNSIIMEVELDGGQYVNAEMPLLEETEFNFAIEFNSKEDEYLFKARSMVASNNVGTISGKDAVFDYESHLTSFSGTVARNGISYESSYIEFGSEIKKKDKVYANKPAFPPYGYSNPKAIFMTESFNDDECEYIKEENKMVCSNEVFETKTQFGNTTKRYSVHNFIYFFDDSGELTKLDFYYDEINFYLQETNDTSNDHIYEETGKKFINTPYDEALRRDFDYNDLYVGDTMHKSSSIVKGTLVYN